jgi:mono/diheme cytochrome c family protein
MCARRARLTSALLVAVLAVGCRRAAAPNELAALREHARGILERHCGECHVPERSTALAGALAVFNLRQADWAQRMSERQLRNALWRLGEPIPPEGRPNDVSDAERAAFSRYVEAEIAHRSISLPAGAPPSGSERPSP